MEHYLVFLLPYCKRVLWGNDQLKQFFPNTFVDHAAHHQLKFGQWRLKNKHHDDHQLPIGEMWLVSAYQNHESIVQNTGTNLSQFIHDHPGFFQLDDQQVQSFIYPNLIKMIDAKLPLSIQVHPNDVYAQQFDSLGKNECWYVLKNEGDQFVLGTNTSDFAQFQKVINSPAIENYLNWVSLNAGDFVYLPAGLIHAIPANTIVFELQQASDLTYRIYDYQRKDAQGNLRALHLEQALVTIDLNLVPNIQKQVRSGDFFSAGAFHLRHFHLANESINISNASVKHCVEVVIYQGSGHVSYPLHLQQITHEIKAGDVFLVSGQISTFTISGHLKCFINLN